MSLKRSVKVAVRIRPLNDTEKTLRYQSILDTTPDKADVVVKMDGNIEFISYFSLLFYIWALFHKRNFHEKFSILPEYFLE